VRYLGVRLVQTTHLSIAHLPKPLISLCLCVDRMGNKLQAQAVQSLGVWFAQVDQTTHLSITHLPKPLISLLSLSAQDGQQITGPGRAHGCAIGAGHKPVAHISLPDLGPLRHGQV